MAAVTMQAGLSTSVQS